MATANVQIKKILVGRGNTTIASNYSGVRGEITMDTDLKALRIHDGVQVGGYIMAGQDWVTQAIADAALGGIDTSVFATTANLAIIDANVGAFQTYANLTFGTSTYGNANVASYLLDNPQGGVYSNANVAAYLLENPQGSTYSNANVSSYLSHYTGQLVFTSSVANISGVDIIKSNEYQFANGVNILTGIGGTYSNANVASYLIENVPAGTYSNTNVQAYLGANVGAYQTWANAFFSTVTNAAAAATNTNSLRANVTAANTAIDNVNANIGAFQTYANTTFSTVANAGSQQTAINSIDANIGAFQTYANLHFSDTTYGNVQMLANLATATVVTNLQSNISAANTRIVSLEGNVGAYESYANLTFSTVANAGTQQTAINNLNSNIGAFQTYSNSNVGAIKTSLTNLDANVGAFETYANSTFSTVANAGTQQTAINNLNSNIGAYQIYANANVGTISTTLTNLHANVGAYESYANLTFSTVANAGTQQTEIDGLRSNITAANSAISTLQGQVYSNTNVAAYLAGNVTVGNLTVNDNAVILGNLRVQGTQTTVNTATLNVTDLFITVANAATQASDANGAGLRVAGALANIKYMSTSDYWDFNKPITANIRQTGNISFADGTFMTTSWVANAGTQQTQIDNFNANLGAYQTWANGAISSVTVANLTSGGNVVALSNTGNLFLPNNISFTSSPAMSTTGIVFGDGSYQYTAFTGTATVANLDNNGSQVRLDSGGTLSVPNRIAPIGTYGVAISPTNLPNTTLDWNFSAEGKVSKLYAPYSVSPVQSSIHFNGGTGYGQLGWDSGAGLTGLPYAESLFVASTGNLNVVGTNVHIRGGRTGNYDLGNQYQLGSGGYALGELSGFTFIGAQFTSYEFVQSTATDYFTTLLTNNLVIDAGSYQGSMAITPVTRTSFGMATNDKYVFQIKVGRLSAIGNNIGVITESGDFTQGLGAANFDYSVGFDSYGVYNGPPDYAAAPKFGVNDYVIVAVDRVNHKIWIKVLYNEGNDGQSDWNSDPTADPTTNTGGFELPTFGGAAIYPAVTSVNGNNYADLGWTFGQDGNITLPGGNATIGHNAISGDTQTYGISGTANTFILVDSSGTEGSTSVAWTSDYANIGTSGTAISQVITNMNGVSLLTYANTATANPPNMVTLGMGGNLTVSKNILPANDNTQDLGSATQRFRHLYVGPGTVYIGNAAISTTATGNLILPGVTRAVASSAYAEEVQDTGRQTHAFTTSPTVIDGALWLQYTADSMPTFTPAVYSVDQLDGEGFIDGITIVSRGAGYSGAVAEAAHQPMWATESLIPLSPFNAGDWVEIPFRVQSRAGESEYDFSTATDRLTSEGHSAVMGTDGTLTTSGNLAVTGGTVAFDTIKSGFARNNIAVDSVDNYGLYITKEAYPDAGTELQVGFIATDSSNPSNTDTIDSISDEGEFWFILTGQTWSADFVNFTGATASWQFGKDGILTLPTNTTVNPNVSGNWQVAAYSSDFDGTGRFKIVGISQDNNYFIVESTSGPGDLHTGNLPLGRAIWATGFPTAAYISERLVNPENTDQLLIAQGQFTTSTVTVPQPDGLVLHVETSPNSLDILFNETAGLSIKGDYVNGQWTKLGIAGRDWKFDQDGILTLPNGTAIGDKTGISSHGPAVDTVNINSVIGTFPGLDFSSPNGVAVGWLVNGPGVTNATILGIDAGNGFIEIDGGAFQVGESYTFTGTSSISIGTKITVNSNDWTFGTDGNLTLPTDGNINYANGVNILSTVGSGSVVSSDVAPQAPTEGELWYDQVSGRLYVWYDDTWVDASIGGVNGGGADLGKFKIVDAGSSVGWTTTDDAGGYGGYPMFLSPDGEGHSYITIPNDAQAALGVPLRVGGTQANSAVVIETNTGSWTFGNTGTLNIPGSISNTKTRTVGVYNQGNNYEGPGGGGYLWISQSEWPTADQDIHPGDIVSGYTVAGPLVPDGGNRWLIPMGDIDANSIFDVSSADITWGVTAIWNFGGNTTLTVPGRITTSGNVLEIGSNGNPYGSVRINSYNNAWVFTKGNIAEEFGYFTIDSGYESGTPGLIVRDSDMVHRMLYSSGNIASAITLTRPNVPTVEYPPTVNISLYDDSSTPTATTWTFGLDGNLTFPSGMTILGPSAGTQGIIATGNSIVGVVSSGLSGASALEWVNDLTSPTAISAVVVNSPYATGAGAVQISTGAAFVDPMNPFPEHNWFFESDGNLTLPLNGNINYANGVNILSTVVSGGGGTTYSNANVASYLVANPQAGTYSNTNVAAYLVANPQGSTYSNSNVASYLVANPQAGTYSNSNVAAYLVANPQGSTYSNSNVASYLVANPQAGTYSNSNVSSYLTANPPAGTYSNTNVASYLAASTVTTGVFQSKQIREAFGNVTPAGNAFALDCSAGQIFNVIMTNISANFTANLTNLSLATGYVTTVSMILNQGSSGYVPSVLKIADTTTAFTWQGSSTPAGVANRKDVVAFNILNAGGSYIVLAQLVSF